MNDENAAPTKSNGSLMQQEPGGDSIDRHRLAYLNGLEKLNCLYCSYANGVIAYVRDIAARTEQYWCPIRHARRVRHPHERYESFAAYGDAAGFRRTLPSQRAALKK